MEGVSFMNRENWYWITLFVAALAFSSWKTFAAEIRYIPENERSQLSQDFETASPIKEISGKWICDMYGMSSHLQVSKNVRLYSFEPGKNGFSNLGAQAQIVPVYNFTRGEMIGSSGNLNDQLRQTKTGQLLSKLTHEGQVIAYSRCRRS